jgi:hypothetical protein
MLEGRKKQDFCLSAIIDQYSHNIPFVDVCCYYHCICERERYKLDVIFIESYQDMRPLSSHDWVFNRHMIYLAIVLSLCLLFLKLKLEPPVIVWMVPKVGKLMPCWEDS